MSHLKERKEKNCLNCNAIVNGKFCSICGQENVEPQETALHLINHFFQDITHFDGKFFTSVKYIFTKPGYLTSEYVEGKRAKHLNPVRFYVFTSFVFFLLYFSLFTEKKEFIKFDSISKKDSLKLIKEVKELGINDAQINATLKNYGIDSLKKIVTSKDSNLLDEVSKDYKSKKQFDSLNNAGLVKENYFEKIFIAKQLYLKEKYGNDDKKILEEIIHKFPQVLPQLLFLSLPFFALILKLLYYRRKKFYYVSHAIFTIHIFIFFYIKILLTNALEKFAEFKFLGWLNILALLINLYAVFYLYKSFRNFYQQSRGKTLLKLIILFFCSLFLLVFILILLFGLSFLKL